ncbi:Dere\GG22670-PA-like protein [Anopheles sinensis]|uniref:Dere\GG22670-PA-like protein n=1 Tax=Anopheles sinensis TaxID=74873 RepID=A0A084V9W6_ANOSI|nr:Dere\GG22670-PA-like protein [Anopheles sinensis]
MDRLLTTAVETSEGIACQRSDDDNEEPVSDRALNRSRQDMERARGPCSVYVHGLRAHRSWEDQHEIRSRCAFHRIFQARFRSFRGGIGSKPTL